ncbi:hypothetical protein K469DRAFT_708395 [Zopfia rhizophila CBS 207.26]|uniref:HTH CENPB-type domain-containing protein n=1 Tax=Zopfia rhizophila CBS 207.26 TaxID=1314779 RepID=A0A6A6E1M7_9PEZI|nr:hypothetical protein K469DRAFT_708395 [Zopfia rhizophila CBS 207.26]
MSDYQKMEAQIALALKWMSTKTSYKLTDVAAMFGVPYDHLKRRRRSPTSKSTRQKTNQRLTPAQLKALELYIKRLDDLRQPPLVDMWRAAAEPANPRIRRVKQKSQELTRVISQEQDVIEDHFWEYKQVVDKLGLQPKDIWNMDECRTRIGVGSN